MNIKSTGMTVDGLSQYFQVLLKKGFWNPHIHIPIHQSINNSHADTLHILVVQQLVIVAGIQIMMIHQQ